MPRIRIDLDAIWMLGTMLCYLLVIIEGLDQETTILVEVVPIQFNHKFHVFEQKCLMIVSILNSLEQNTPFSNLN